MELIYPAVWMALPKEVKVHLAKVFGLSPTGITEVRDNTVVSDGYTIDDLRKISRENMCNYIGSEETFLRAWEITLSKVHTELHPGVIEIKDVISSVKHESKKSK